MSIPPVSCPRPLFPAGLKLLSVEADGKRRRSSAARRAKPPLFRFKTLIQTALTTARVWNDGDSADEHDDSESDGGSGAVKTSAAVTPCHGGR